VIALGYSWSLWGKPRELISQILSLSEFKINWSAALSIKTRKKTFILCLGHQRCGTTWLYKHLAQSDHFAGGALKEYHIWDALDIELLNEHRLVSPPQDKEHSDYLRYQMQEDANFYFDYFASLLDEEKTITADITPSYSALSFDRIKNIQKGFALQNIEVRAVLVLRNPIDRIKSATSFNMNRQNFNEGIPSSATTFEEALKNYYQTEHCEIRTNYERSVKNAQKALGSRNVYVAIYETMFSSEHIDKISKFFGVYPFKKRKEDKINRTTRETEKTSELDRRIMKRFQSTYDYCSRAFPETKDLWSNN
jgi:hypothetical protein